MSSDTESAHKLIRNKTMKFNNLTTLQKVLVLCDLAGFTADGTITHEPYTPYGETVPYETSQYGLSYPLHVYRLSSVYWIESNKKDDMRKIRISKTNVPGQVVILPTRLHSVDYSDCIGVGKYGVGYDILLKKGDIKVVLTEIQDFLISFEKLLKVTPDLSAMVKKLIKQIPRAEKLPESLFDHFYVNEQIASKITALRSIMLSYETIPMYDSYLSEELNEDYIQSEYLFKSNKSYFEVKHNCLPENPKAYVLCVNFGTGGDDKIDIGYRTVESNQVLPIGSFMPDNENDEVIFLTSVRDNIRDIVQLSDVRDHLSAKLEVLLEKLDKYIADPNAYQNFLKIDSCNYY